MPAGSDPAQEKSTGGWRNSGRPRRLGLTIPGLARLDAAVLRVLQK
jgi:hypothetical protein